MDHAYAMKVIQVIVAKLHVYRVMIATLWVLVSEESVFVMITTMGTIAKHFVPQTKHVQRMEGALKREFVYAMMVFMVNLVVKNPANMVEMNVNLVQNI